LPKPAKIYRPPRTLYLPSTASRLKARSSGRQTWRPSQPLTARASFWRRRRPEKSSSHQRRPRRKRRSRANLQIHPQLLEVVLVEAEEGERVARTRLEVRRSK